MTSSVLSNWAGNIMLVLLLRHRQCWLAAHTSDPTVTGITATEVAGGEYQRRKLSFSEPSGKTAAGVNAVKFSSMPGCVVTHLAVWDAIADGNLIFTIELDEPIEVEATATLFVNPLDVGIQL